MLLWLVQFDSISASSLLHSPHLPSSAAHFPPFLHIAKKREIIMSLIIENIIGKNTGEIRKSFWFTCLVFVSCQIPRHRRFEINLPNAFDKTNWWLVKYTNLSDEIWYIFDGSNYNVFCLFDMSRRYFDDENQRMRS